MKRFPILLAAMTTVSGIATELHVFSAGQPAKAQEVNDNFQRLDTAIQNRATTSTVSSIQAAVISLQATKVDVSVAAKKADSVWVAGQIAGVKASIPAPQNIGGKADTGWVAKQLGTKADTSKLSDLTAKVSALQSTTNTIAISYFPKSSVTGSSGAIPKFGNGSTLGNSSITEAGNGSVSFGGGPGWIGGAISTSSADNGAAWTVSNPSQSWSFQIRGDGHNGSAVNAWTIQDETKNTVRVWGDASGMNVLTPLTVEGRQVWHTGNLSSDLLFYERGNAPVSWAALTINGSYSVRPENYDGPAGYYNFGDIAVFGNGTMKTQVYHSHHGEVLVRTKWNEGDWNSWARTWTSLNFDPTKYVLASGGTITGDLRITGKLTTPPGATPADYVFEPDYQLMSLSEVEAFTKANKHLPEVPSAKEMTENGVDMAAMNMVLLKKVEELTLHAIALQKDVEAQKTLLAQQKAQFEERLQRLESTTR